MQKNMCLDRLVHGVHGLHLGYVVTEKKWMKTYPFFYMDVSENGGPPKSSNLIGISIINHPFWGTPIFGNTHMGILSASDVGI